MKRGVCCKHLRRAGMTVIEDCTHSLFVPILQITLMNDYIYAVVHKMSGLECGAVAAVTTADSRYRRPRGS
jgi:hypothetical protein